MNYHHSNRFQNFQIHPRRKNEDVNTSKISEILMLKQNLNFQNVIFDESIIGIDDSLPLHKLSISPHGSQRRKQIFKF